MEYIAKVKDSEPLPIMTSEYYYLTITAKDLKTARKLAEEYAQGDKIIYIRRAKNNEILEEEKDGSR